MSVAISVKHVGKRFVRQRHHRVPALSALYGKLTGREEEKFFWALKDVSFDVQHGERVAILGRNGAGKTTLLRLIAGAMLPTRGTIDVGGTIAPLFGVGTGFHGELTGHENVMLSASMFGLTERETRAFLPAIEEFAGIGEFMDQPVKHYSSGMRARLGFALADQMVADIMLLDEVLSVGDGEFRAKSAKRIRQRIEEGSTMILVTHNIRDAQELCETAIVIRNGQANSYHNMETAMEEIYPV